MSALILPLSIIGVILAIIIILTVVLIPRQESSRAKELSALVATYARDNPQTEISASTLGNLRTQGARRTATFLENRGWTERLAHGLSGAGITMKPEEYVLITLAIGVGGGLLLFLLSGIIAAAVLGAFCGICVPVMVVRIKTSRRQARFLADLPDTLTAVASGLSAGASLPQAFDSVARESSGPMRDELQRVLATARLGTTIPDALEESAVRMKCVDLELVVMAMRLQGLHGGNLSELLNTVSATLRERVQMKRHVSALSAEGRLSVYVLVALPLVVLAFMALVRPLYFNYFISTFAGLMMLINGAIMMTLGYLWARSIAKVEI